MRREATVCAVSMCMRIVAAMHQVLTIASEAFLQSEEFSERCILPQHPQAFSLSHAIAALPR